MRGLAVLSYLYDDSVDTRQRLYVLSTNLTVAMLAVSTALMALSKEYIRDIPYMLGVIALIILCGMLAFKTNKFDVGIVSIISILSFAYFPISFFNEDGASGAAPLWFIFNLFLIGILMRGRTRIIFSLLEEAIGIACYALSYFYPQLVADNSSLLTYIFSFITLVMVTTSIMIIINWEHKLYIQKSKIAEEQRRQIEALNASQNRFFSSMSHEIRTPINTIIGLNEMIMREDISDEVAEDSANIRVAGKLLLNLINDILDMSKFQAGDMHLLIDSYSTGDMLSELVGMLWIRAKEKNLEFKVNVAPDIPAELMGDEVRIKQILMNILNNAIKYTKEGSITLSVECEHKENDSYNMIYSVADTGMGIKKEDIPYLFTAFRRVDESNTRHIEGTGLGLSIVKQFLDLMNGKVTVNSIYTQGSTFIVEIPQKAATDKKIGVFDYEKKHSIGKRINYKKRFEAPDARILAVDDNNSNLLVVTKLLRDTKMTIDTATSGAEALRKTLDNKYDLIFMDHLMPEMDGIECFEKIREQTGGKSKDAKVVVLTANAGEENRELYARAKFDGYLIKPISGAELENELIRLLPPSIVHATNSGDEIIKDTVSWMQTGQKKMRIMITTDTVADIPQYLLVKYGITAIPHKVQTIEGTTFKDGIEIDTTGVLAYLENKSNTMLPVPPTVKEYEDFFAKQLTKANNIVHIAVSSGIANSGYPTAEEAAKSFDNVTVIDSSNLSSGQGIIAMIASYLVQSGRNPDEIKASIDRIKKFIHTSFIVGDLTYMARTGQVSGKRTSLLNSFMAKPVLALKNGKMALDKIYFGSYRKAWAKYINSCLSRYKASDVVMFVTYVGLNRKDLDWVKQQIELKAHFKDVIFIQASPAIAVNCGPGTFGLLFMDKELKKYEKS